MQKKSIVLLILALVGLAILWLVPDRDQVGKTITLDKVDQNQVDEIKIKKNQENISVVKKDSRWVVKTRKDYPAQSKKVMEILQEFQEAKVAEWISGSEAYDRYGLSEDQRTKITFLNAGNQVFEIILGNSGNRTDSYYFLYRDDKNIYQTTGKKSIFEVTENELRDPSIFSFPASSVKKIFIEKNRKRLTLTSKMDDGNKVTTNSQSEKKTWQDESKRRYKAEEVNDVLNTLSHLKAVDFEDDVRTFKTSLAKIEVHTQSEVYQISIQEQKEDKNYRVRIEGNDTIFVISELDGERLLKDLQPI